MQMIRHVFVQAVTVFVIAAAFSVPAVAQSLIVLNKSDHEAALVNPATRTVAQKLPTGKGPHEVAVSPNGRMAYVTNYGSFAIFRDAQQAEQRRMEPGHTITVLDLKKRAVAATWELGDYKQPHGIAVSSNGKRVWVTVEGSKAVLELDAKSGKVLTAWPTEQEVSHMVVATPNQRKLYVANIRSGSVTVIDRSVPFTKSAVKTIVTAPGAEGIDVTPDGREVWVVNRAADSISVIEVASDAVTKTFASGGKFPIRVKFTPDGRLALVSNAQSNQVAVFDAKTRELLGTIEVGAVPVGIQITPDGKLAYVANTNANLVSVLDIATRKVTATFTTGNEPDGMAWAK